jgi:hypothetical protein
MLVIVDGIPIDTVFYRREIENNIGKTGVRDDPYNMLFCCCFCKQEKSFNAYRTKLMYLITGKPNIGSSFCTRYSGSCTTNA